MAKDDVVTLTFSFTIAEGTDIYTLSLHDALPICTNDAPVVNAIATTPLTEQTDTSALKGTIGGTEAHMAEIQSQPSVACPHLLDNRVTTGLALDEAALIALVTPQTVTKASGSSAG